MSAYTFDENLFSDLHKDARGYRPSGDYYTWLKNASDDEKQSEWDGLIREMHRRCEEEDEQERLCLIDFERKISKVMNTGAKSRQMAVQWIYDSLNDPYDYEYADFQFGIPYGTFKKELTVETI